MHQTADVSHNVVTLVNQNDSLFHMIFNPMLQIDLMSHFKMSTSRDFRINAAVLQTALEKEDAADESEEEDDDDNDDGKDGEPDGEEQVTKAELCMAIGLSVCSEEILPLYEDIFFIIYYFMLNKTIMLAFSHLPDEPLCYLYILLWPFD